ncbi:hypothetical protein Tco_0899104 [Tanacetum coccineum]
MLCIVSRSSCADTGRMFSAASTAAMKNANATENIFLSNIGDALLNQTAIIFVIIWLSVEDVLTGVDMMNE